MEGNTREVSHRMKQRRAFPFWGRKPRPANQPEAFASIFPNRECLLTMDIFRDLEPEAIAAIEKQAAIRICFKGQVLYSQKDRAEVLFLLKQGRVHLYRLTPSGKRLDVRMIEPGTFFGEMPFVGESLRHTFAEAVEDSQLCVMSRADLERVMRQRSEVALRMIEVLGQRLAFCEARLEEMAYRSVPARIATVLLRLSQEQEGTVVVITHQEIGEMVGALRESVTKVLDDFRRAELIELGRAKIQVKDVIGLQERRDWEP